MWTMVIKELTLAVQTQSNKIKTDQGIFAYFFCFFSSLLLHSWLVSELKNIWKQDCEILYDREFLWYFATWAWARKLRREIVFVFPG